MWYLTKLQKCNIIVLKWPWNGSTILYDIDARWKRLGVSPCLLHKGFLQCKRKKEKKLDAEDLLFVPSHFYRDSKKRFIFFERCLQLLPLYVGNEDRNGFFRKNFRRYTSAKAEFTNNLTQICHFFLNFFYLLFYVRPSDFL